MGWPKEVDTDHNTKGDVGSLSIVPQLDPARAPPYQEVQLLNLERGSVVNLTTWPTLVGNWRTLGRHLAPVIVYLTCRFSPLAYLPGFMLAIVNKWL